MAAQAIAFAGAALPQLDDETMTRVRCGVPSWDRRPGFAGHALRCGAFALSGRGAAELSGARSAPCGADWRSARAMPRRPAARPAGPAGPRLRGCGRPSPSLPARRAPRRDGSRYSARKAVVIGSRAARSAGNSPPTRPMPSAHFSPLHSKAGETLNWNTTWLKLLPRVDTL